ncbi:YcaO-like family protein [Cytobacillus sp. Hm23]
MVTKFSVRNYKKAFINIVTELDDEFKMHTKDNITYANFRGTSLVILEGDHVVEIMLENLYSRNKDSSLQGSVLTKNLQSTIEATKHIYFFLQNMHKLVGISLTHTAVTFHYKNNNVSDNLKSSIHEKRLECPITVKDLKHLLVFYNGGCVIDDHNGFVSVANSKNYSIQGFGYDFNKKSATFKAIAEYLERSAAAEKLPNTVENSYHNMKERAINPRLLGVYDRNIDENNTTLQLYNDDLKINWVKAKSLISNNEYFVPEQVCQYLLTDIKNRYIYESSNGCSVGNSIAEASLFSILEIIERDTFMNAWFNENESIQLIHFDKDDTNIKGRKIFFDELGYDLEFYYLRNKTNLPVIWCLLRSNNTKNTIYSITGLGCHLNIKYAIDSAFYEVYNSYYKLVNSSKQKIINNINRIEHTNKINDVLDHIYYFLSYRSKPLIEAKIKGCKIFDYSKVSESNFQSVNIEKELQYVIDQTKGAYKDVLIVNQTNHFLESLSLYCTKAIIIGATPLDFTTNLVRLVNQEKTNKRMENSNIHPLA